MCFFDRHGKTSKSNKIDCTSMAHKIGKAPR